MNIEHIQEQLEKTIFFYSKSRRISKKDIKKVLKKHIQFVRRNLNQALELVSKIEKQELIFSKKENKRFEKLKKKIELAKEILSQQEELYKEGKLPKGTGRIVSFTLKGHLVIEKISDQFIDEKRITKQNFEGK